jgi:Ca2+-binding RTX toxin-like protein
MLDTFTGDNANRNWLLTGADMGIVGALSFASFEALTGGNGRDTFRFAAAASISNTINGGGGINELDYAQHAAQVTVNLTTGAATATNGVTGIRNVTGGALDDLLVGDSFDNALVGLGGDDLLLGGGGADDLLGGAGRDLIFGGSGADVIDGGLAGDVLLGGLLTYFDEGTGVVDVPALTAIRNEWKRTNVNYNGRITNLFNGGGLNGQYVLNSTTVLDDGAVDTLFGRGGLDWFLIGLSDAIQDLNSGGTEIVTTL